MNAQQRITITGAKPYRLPLVKPWRSASSSISERQGWLIAVQTEDGYSGWGDCAPFPQLGTETADAAAYALTTLLPKFIGMVPQEALECLAALDNCPPAARYGIETALADLAAQMLAMPLAQWLNPQAGRSVLLNAALGSLDADIIQRTQLALAAGYRVLKIKVGLAAWETEIQQLQVLAAILPPGVQLRLDANQAWSKQVAHRALSDLAELPVEAVEEPLAGADFAILAELQNCVPFALALDESIVAIPQDVLLPSCPVKRLVLKPTVLGGLSNTLALTKLAQQRGLECIVTSTLESGVGVRAAAHLAAALGGSLAHGLATGSWLAKDVVAAPVIKHGYFWLDNGSELVITAMPT